MTTDPPPSRDTSSPCSAAEFDEQEARRTVDPQNAGQVAAWRKEERARLIEARLALTVAARQAHSAGIAAALDRLLPDVSGKTISLYWPFRGEPNLRAWMQAAHARGARIALPVVVAKATPLVFRAWAPGCAMTRGVWNIPIPEDGAEVVPDVTIAPLVGVDAACFRLGYGGGFFDRTLAALEVRPQVIGVGLPLTRIETIHPQDHDIPMDVVVTFPDDIRHRSS